MVRVRIMEKMMIATILIGCSNFIKHFSSFYSHKKTTLGYGFCCSTLSEDKEAKVQVPTDSKKLAAGLNPDLSGSSDNSHMLINSAFSNSENCYTHYLYI